MICLDTWLTAKLMASVSSTGVYKYDSSGTCLKFFSTRYHKQFKAAAKQRYFVSQEDDVYFHSYMADYFLGTYGGGISKPFRYTEIQKHMFKLRSKDSTADRSCPAQPLAFYNKAGKINRCLLHMTILYCNSKTKLYL